MILDWCTTLLFTSQIIVIYGRYLEYSKSLYDKWKNKFFFFFFNVKIQMFKRLKAKIIL
jgi:hypothetical protein